MAIVMLTRCVSEGCRQITFPPLRFGLRSLTLP